MFTTPSWPADYPFDEFCTWIIEPVHDGHDGTKLAFMDFDLYDNNVSCRAVHVSVKGKNTVYRQIQVGPGFFWVHLSPSLTTLGLNFDSVPLTCMAPFCIRLLGETQHTSLKRGGGGGGILPCMSHIGLCCPKAGIIFKHF